MRKACPGGSTAPSAKSARLLDRPQWAPGQADRGGVKVKLGDKVINLRGNVGVGDNGGNFKAGVGLPF